jgi:Transglutaminase-like superfamily
MMQAWSSLVLAFVVPKDCAAACRSNSTHVAWRCSPQEAVERSLVDCGCWHQTRQEAERDCLRYLHDNIMPFDVPNMESMGFDPSGKDVDGLSNGMVGPTITLALDVKCQYEWTDSLPKSVFYEYVLNYANANEARSNWRSLLQKVVEPMVNTSTSIPEVVKTVNTHLWKALARRDNECIVFESGQTPLIYDPMSVIAFGYASCTGLAILFIDALRSSGVPARLVGTPAWWRDREKGNHNWVEVWWDNEWYFMEPSAAQDTVDTLDRDPCDRWFCNSQCFPGTEVYAARLDRTKADTHYPMAWEWNSTDVPGENRTDYYVQICSKCK